MTIQVRKLAVRIRSLDRYNPNAVHKNTHQTSFYLLLLCFYYPRMINCNTLFNTKERGLSDQRFFSTKWNHFFNFLITSSIIVLILHLHNFCIESKTRSTPVLWFIASFIGGFIFERVATFLCEMHKLSQVNRDN